MPNMPNIPTSDYKLFQDLPKNQCKTVAPQGGCHAAVFVELLHRRVVQCERFYEVHEEYFLKNSDVQCDQLKIYPTAVTVFTEILNWFNIYIYI